MYEIEFIFLNHPVFKPYGVLRNSALTDDFLYVYHGASPRWYTPPDKSFHLSLLTARITEGVLCPKITFE
jgi:hypothetical protein